MYEEDDFAFGGGGGGGPRRGRSPVSSRLPSGLPPRGDLCDKFLVRICFARAPISRTRRHL